MAKKKAPPPASAPAGATPAAEVQASDPSKFKCTHCGKSKPLAEKVEGLPAEWASCGGCHLLAQAPDRFRDVSKSPYMAMVTEWRRRNLPDQYPPDPAEDDGYERERDRY